MGSAMVLLKWAAPDEAPARGPWDLLMELCDRGPGYSAAREKLVRYFGFKGASDADELADVTLERLANKLTPSEIALIRNPVGYMLAFARLVFLEAVKQEASQRARLRAAGAEASDDDLPERERELAVLERCLEELAAGDRELLMRYYQGSGGRRIEVRHQIARELGVSANVLRARVHRLRLAIERRLSGMCESERPCASDVSEARRARGSASGSSGTWRVPQ